VDRRRAALIVRRHGGDVAVRSSTQEGTTVEVVVPLRTPA
jgi:signal transduction histidine kinase